MPLEIAQLGQPVLREIAAAVAPEQIAEPAFQEFLQAMIETLGEAKGVGLAAPQVFAGVRVFLAAILPAQQEGDPPGVEAFINPKLTPLTQEITRAWEGCLSFQELLVLVPRFRTVRIDYLDSSGAPKALALSNFAARVVQHELDHLNGILTIDRAASTRHIVKASEINDVRAALGELDHDEDDPDERADDAAESSP
jgi:peptide deformylase